MSEFPELLLREPTSRREINLAIVRTAQVLWESYIPKDNGARKECEWVTQDGIKVTYQHYDTPTYGHQAYISFKALESGAIKEYKISLEAERASEGVKIEESSVDGDYNEINQLKNSDYREAIRYAVYSLLHEGLILLRDQNATLNEQRFANIVVDISLDAYEEELKYGLIDDVVEQILKDSGHDPGDDIGFETGPANWLINEDALKSRATERAKLYSSQQ